MCFELGMEMNKMVRIMGIEENWKRDLKKKIALHVQYILVNSAPLMSFLNMVHY